MKSKNTQKPIMVNKKRDEEIGLLEKKLSASMRALSGDKNLSVVLKQSNNFNNAISNNKLIINLPNIDDWSNNLAALRGNADAEALKIIYHDKNLHHNKLPKDKIAAQIFDKLELMRIEAISGKVFAGASSNIGAKINQDYMFKNFANMENSDQVFFSDAVALVVREFITGKRSPVITDGFMNKFRTQIKENIIDILPQMLNYLNEQDKYADLAKMVIDKLSFAMEDIQKEQTDEELPDDENLGEQSSSQNSAGDKKIPQQASEASNKTKSQFEDKQQEEALQNNDNTTDEINGQANNIGDNFYNKYKIYTKQFDQIVTAGDLCDAKELTKLRQILDEKIQNLPRNAKMHANKFLRKLLSKQLRITERNLEDGLLDDIKLAEIVADPNLADFYKWERYIDEKNTIVSLLIDNSGSMRGRPITVAAICAEILAKTLEACGIKVEILGFSTVEWKGGKSRQKWLENNSPQNPGRLNDVRHIIYKSANSNWRVSKNNLGLMLKEGVLKENIDGEAIEWACSRLYTRLEKRKILMVISDGAPVDDSTISANYSSYLDEHLRATINKIQKENLIELVAIGIGHDVTKYYSRAVTIKDVENLGDAMFKQLSDIFD